MARRKTGGLYVDRVVRRYKDRCYTSYLLRRSYREGGKVKKQTLGNITHLPPALIELVRRGLAGESFVAGRAGFAITRSLPHGHVAAVLAMVRRLGLEQLLARTPCRERELVLGMVVSRILAPASKLATGRTWGSTTLGETLGIAGADENELYAALDWLLARQPAVERALARRHLGAGALVLYDVTSTYVEGSHCPLAQHGYSRDRRRDRPQIVFGVVLDEAGRPLAVEAFAGNTADPATVERQLAKVRDTFGLHDLVLVGDRGMLTQARIDRLKEVGGWGWISCLRAPAIQALVAQGAVQLSLFDTRNLVELSDPAYPGERLLVCKNPLVAEERARKRAALLAQTEQALAQVASLVARGRLKRAAAIGLRVGRVVNRWQMAKHFTLTIAEGSFAYARQAAAIAAEAALDGLYVVRTSVPAERLGAAEVVSAYKSLSLAERVFRTFKTTDLAVRPIYHYAEGRVRAHLFLCLLAAYVQWHLQRAWAPLLFHDEAPPLRLDPVANAKRSAQAQAKDQTKQTPVGLPVHSFHTLLGELATLTKNRCVPAGADPADARAAFTLLTTPTPLQAQAFALLGMNLSAV
jgi:hypothetical protein